VSPAQTLALREARAAGESGAALVTEEQIDTVALAGTADHLRARLAAWLDAGLDTPIALPVGDDVVAQVGLIGQELAAWLEGRP
jgi:alkanesulfonate monooxygenase SsuD/methylene tetrahydromethanopterin reductase-like flavin-dependent oxidoreductase (luciferase family)